MAPQVAPQPKKGTPGDKVTLLSFGNRPGSVLSSSPFAGKLEMALRMAGIEFAGKRGDLLNRQQAPKRKVRPPDASRHARTCTLASPGGCFLVGRLATHA